MKLCVCVSGQVRDLDALIGIRKAFEGQPYETQFVFSLWRRTGVKNSGAFRFPQRNRLFGPAYAKALPHHWNFDHFYTALPEMRATLNDSVEISEVTIRAVFPDATIDIEDETLFLEFESDVGDQNSLKMLYKIWRANQLKRKLEAKSDVRFDRVLRVRPDSFISPVLAGLVQDTGDVLYLPWLHEDGRAADEIALGSSRQMDIYSQLFLKTAMSPMRRWGGIHAELYDHLKENEINFQSAQLGRTFFQIGFANQLYDCIENAKFGDIGTEEAALLRMANAVRNGTGLELIEIINRSDFHQNGCIVSAASILADHLEEKGQHKAALYLRSLAVSNIRINQLDQGDKQYAKLVQKSINELGDSRIKEGQRIEFEACLDLGSAKLAKLTTKPWIYDLTGPRRDMFFEKLNNLNGLWALDWQ